MDAVVPLSHSLAWAAAPHSAALVHVVTVLNDKHPLRFASSAQNLREWLQALLLPDAQGAASDAQWEHGLPDTMLAEMPDVEAGADADTVTGAAGGSKHQPWAQRFQAAAQA